MTSHKLVKLSVAFCIFAAIWSPEPIKWVLMAIYTRICFNFMGFNKDRGILGSGEKVLDFTGAKL